ncbi:hypothetical protein P154DRAFT_299942 [Amniculicola lignicola CBS 123094]|uniref:Uncharacterized protein n=1 Tax=Amniculicola lignicola CBS 123094 TaxID=1392246 RepID=A0A6A5W891_9PLEO|nr:hypothetical protein P154DRAFT_299942 [Amniculicola lignicola CBS 123094]
MPPHLPTLPRNATAKEARAAAGLDFFHWEQFYEITREEAEDLLKRYPNCTWASLSYTEKEASHDRVTDRLKASKIEEVRRDILRWRMANVIRDCKTTAVRAAARAAAPSSTETQPASSEKTEKTTRPYDPVRDV